MGVSFYRRIPKTNKYGNKKLNTEDGKFDSMREYNRWLELKLLEKGHLIADLKRQVPFELVPTQKTETETLRAVKYIADFTYYENGELVVEDAKGMKTPEYKIKKKLMLEKFGILIRES